MVLRGVAVEKLGHQEFSEIASRQEARQTISAVFTITRLSTFFKKTDFFNSHRISQ
jgi:hypothetical protein